MRGRTNISEGPDKSGHALREQRFQMLEDIAEELQGEVIFPTCFDVTVRLRQALNDENLSLDRIVAMIRVEPLIPLRLLALANSAAYNTSGRQVRDVKTAVSRLGLKTVRNVALATAMKQMLAARNLVEFQSLANGLWEHSLLSASAAFVVAGEMTRLDQEEALLAGLVHDLGAFYMLYRATQYPELRARPDTVRYLVAQWHESIGVTLVEALKAPSDIVEAIRDHDAHRPPPKEPRTLGDVVFVSNLLAGGGSEWLLQDAHGKPPPKIELGANYLALMEVIRMHAQVMRAMFE